MGKNKAFNYEGPFRIVHGPASVPVRDEDTKEILQFATVDDVIEAVELLGFKYWYSGQPRPENAAYEQLVRVGID